MRPQAQESLIPWSGAVETRRAVDAAHTAFSSWSITTAAERAGFLSRMAQTVRGNLDMLALRYIQIQTVQDAGCADLLGQTLSPDHHATSRAWLPPSAQRLSAPAQPGTQDTGQQRDPGQQGRYTKGGGDAGRDCI